MVQLIELQIIILTGFIVDLLLGDPVYSWHPIRLIGRFIVLLERGLRKAGFDGRGGGVLLVMITEIIFLGVYLLLNYLLNIIHPVLALCFILYICYSCLAIRDMLDHIRPVLKKLEEEKISEAADAVAKVVGRDVRYLNKEGIIRAAIETMAENFVDGFLTPMFYFLAGGIIAFFSGLPVCVTAIAFMLASKVANTLDSMAGYKTPDYYDFGWAAARFDDFVNFFPARISLGVLFLGAAARGFSPVKGFRVAFRDRLKHDSPNSAHAESFVAGALGIRLGGPTKYSNGIKDKPWLGSEYPEPVTRDINKVITLIKRSAWAGLVIILGILAIIKEM